LNPRGIPITCAQCHARRDWLLLNVGEQVFVRCRCAHEWAEPELTREDFDAEFSHVERIYPSLEEAARGLGYDGTLSGTYWS
ncbi:hypothetical protein, partial [Peterkaempfera griseoplana]|uniref:hypothetical protein n=1 Tax=Peterkaempfera griseoplana TaxID=66896 RepID=UPI00099F36C4